jgi:TATA-box binding protein (TBP) (component of TFIID and TFIIIB)
MCDDEWLQFCSGNDFQANIEENLEQSKNSNTERQEPECPQSSELYISTKSKIGYLTKPINLADVFWKIPIVPYHKQSEGVIKKQIKMTLNTENDIDDNLHNADIYDIEDISKRKNKIVKKISIGISSKDLVSYRCKKKGAFYNCFVLIFRILYKGRYKEMHVKVFNTGKLEIPGVPKDDLMNELLEKVLAMLNSEPLKMDIAIKPNSFETVLINSNFNCGFNIHREKLVDLLKMKYELCVSYDPCSYPGIMSKFYYYSDLKDRQQNGKLIHKEKENCDDEDSSHTSTKPLCISFMIFRTGSVLIVGKCDSESIIEEIYTFIKNILMEEYTNIYAISYDKDIKENENNKKKKIKKRKIIVYE